MAWAMLLCVMFSCFITAEGIQRHRPQQIHLSTGSPTQMSIVWNTEEDTKDTRALYGKALNFSHETTGQRHKFVDDGLLRRSQYIHKVTLTQLEPNTRYYYIVGSQTFGYSGVFSFKTWPSGVDWSPRLAVFGDMGNQNAQSLPRLQLDADRGIYDAILHVGDYAYDMHTDNGRVGDEFMRQIEPLAASLPYMTCPGNHEVAYNFSNYRNRFSMPGDLDGRMYYSFTMGPIRFISLNTEAIYSMIINGYQPVLEQHAWLENELKKANLPENRATQPWVIVYGHRPMYCTNQLKEICMLLANPIRVGIPLVGIPGWEELFNLHGVDVAFWAHEHSYERMWPVYNRQVKNGSHENPYTNPGATVHLVTGSAGCPEDHDTFSRSPYDWSAFHSTDYGYTRMTVINATHLALEQVSDDKDGAIIDRFTVIKDKHGSYTQQTNPSQDVL